MKNKHLRTILLSILLLPFISCEKEGGGGSSSTNTSLLPSLSTLYSYLGRTDYEAIVQQFRNSGWTAAINPYDPGYNRYGIVEIVKPFPESSYDENPHYDEYAYYYVFEFDNAIYSAEHEHDYYDAERVSVMHEHFDQILNEQKQLSKNWSMLEFTARIQDANYNYTYYNSIDEFQSAAQHADFLDNTYGYSTSSYSNGITIKVNFGESYIVYRIYKTSIYNQRHNID